MLALFLLFDTDDRFLDVDIDFPDLEPWRSSRCLRLEADQQSEHRLSYAMEAYLKSRIACDRTFLRVVSSWPPEEPLTFTNSSMAASNYARMYSGSGGNWRCRKSATVFG